ncbi:MAG TPA: ECF-type sigma factor [Candidatus Saccharimonadales bacterium]|nr:ECF-type sigma factor [Candidatus Saccharimonadales bacterium]
MAEPSGKITSLLVALRSGDQKAMDSLIPIVYGELRRLARRHLRKEGPGNTLQTTALVHEAYLRLVGADVPWNDRVHFYALASTTMRRVLVDHARAKRRLKRGGDAGNVTLDEDLIPGGSGKWDILELDEAMTRLGKDAPRQVRALELHYFAGLPHADVARALDVSVSTVRNDLRVALAWLRREMTPPR